MAGDKVFIIGRRENVLISAVQTLSKIGAADWIKADLSSVENVDKLVKTLEDKKVTAVDVLINNAGGSIKANGISLEFIAKQYLDNFKANTLSAVCPGPFKLNTLST